MNARRAAAPIAAPKAEDERLRVQIVNVHGKKKRFGAYAGRRRNWKKAYVSLKPGQEINFAQEV